MEKSMPIFYMQLFKVWDKMKDKQMTDPFKVRREVLWQNKAIKVRNKEIYYKEWYKKGIVMFHDILKEDGNFKSMEELSVEFEINIRIMEYNGLISAIPRSWKETVKSMKIPQIAISNQERPFITCNNRLLVIGIVTNKDVYWELVTRKLTKPICAAAWCNRYNIDLENWKVVFKFYANIKDTRMKAFQFKILNNIVPCNLYLNRIGRSDNNTCPVCSELDDLSHYLVLCPATASIWKQLARWWKDISKQELVFTERDILLGLEQRTEKLAMQSQLDDIIMSVKWKIYANKQLGLDTCLYQVLCTIRSMINIQKIIATNNDKGPKHEEFWGRIEDHLT
jgi:hypothetical protein